MRIVGVDPSLTATGLATPEQVTTLRPPPKMVGPERLAWIRNQVMWHAAPIRYSGRSIRDADLAVIEGFAFNAKGRGVFDIAGLGWILRVALHEAGIPWIDPSPEELKKYATGRSSNQGADKQAVRDEVIKRFGFFPTDDNAADAYWLYAMAMDHYGQPLGEMPKANRAVLDKITWPKLPQRVGA